MTSIFDTGSNPYPFINSLHTTAVRILANAIFGEPLLHMISQQPNASMPLIARAPSLQHNSHNNVLFRLTNDYQQWLRRLDKKPETLQQYLHSDTRLKLGIYHERLWQYFLSHNDQTQLLASNLSVRNNGNDLGEFDLIYKHCNIGLVHLEISSKYYLACNQKTEQWQNWLGPGKTDRLDLKLNHCINKQINLADCPIAAEQLCSYLEKLEVEPPTQKKPLVKQLHIGGRLFYRQARPSVMPANPDHLNTQHQTGNWLFLSEWQALLEKYQVNYYLTDKPYWLDTAEGNIGRLKKNSANSEVGSHTTEMLVYRIDELNISARFCFIVPDNWLATNNHP